MDGSAPAAGQRRSIGSYFDDYVRQVFPARRAAAGADWAWPGDEWVTPAMRDATFARLLGGRDPATFRHAVEIGPGSGKYTELLLDRTAAKVTAFEISAGFVASLEERCAAAVAAARLDVRHSDWTDNRALVAALPEGAALDLFFGIDVFLMMDFQSALVYLISAAALLAPGGRFFGTFGDGTSESGWARMLRDAGRHSAFDAAPSTRFHWVDPGFVEHALLRLGFRDVEINRGPDGGLDIARLYVGATLATPLPRGEALALLAPAGDSTNRVHEASPR